MSTSAEIQSTAIVVQAAEKPLYERFAPAGAWLLATFFLVTSIYISRHRLFWYDEVFTTLTARLPNFRTIWDALVRDNYDPTPFGYFVVVRGFDRLFGPGEIGIRLPSALAVAAGMLVTYACARRISDALHGLIAMAALACTLLPFYGYEGRSYGIYFFLSALALWAWITERHPVFFFVLFFCGVTIHYYFLLCLVPFAAEELNRWRPWDKPCARLIAGGLGALAGIAVLSPQVLASGHIGSSWWAPPSFASFTTAFSDLAPHGLFLLSIVLLWTVLIDRRRSPVVESMSPAERTAWLSLLIPVAGFVLALLVTHAFLSRYLIGTLPGVAVATASLVSRRFRGAPQASIGILLLLAGYGIYTQLKTVRHAGVIQSFGPQQERTRAILGLEDQLWMDGKRFIAMQPTDLLFLEARYYSHHPERYVLLVQPSFVGAQHYPMLSWTPAETKQHAHETAFVSLPRTLLQDMQQSGFRSVVKSTDPLNITYLE